MASTSSATAKWRSRVAIDPFSSNSVDSDSEYDDQHVSSATTATSTAHEESKDKDEHNDNNNDEDDDSAQWRDSTTFLHDVAAQSQPHLVASPLSLSAFATVSRGKENLAPSRRNIHIYDRPSASMPTRPPRAPGTPSKQSVHPTTTDALSSSFSVLGKRSTQRAFHTIDHPANAYDDREDDHEEAATVPVTLDVNDWHTIPHLRFGRVAVSDSKTLTLRLENTSASGTARIKFDGCVSSNGANNSATSTQQRFKCDLHVCVVPAERSVQLRITFAPRLDDVDRILHATLRFRVNDQQRQTLQCRVSGEGVARALKRLRFRPAEAFATAAAAPALADATTTRTGVVLAFDTRPLPDALAPDATRSSNDNGDATQRRAESLAGLKRREAASLVLDMTPPRRSSQRFNNHKRQRMDDNASAPTPSTPSKHKRQSTSSFGGSWWKQRQGVYDEHWMQKQEDGFTKWMNYVLLDAGNDPTQQLLGDTDDDAAAAAAAPFHPQQQQRRRFDFTSLRVLTQTRLESQWTRTAAEAFRTPAFDAIAARIEHELTLQKLACRVDRPVYADVGLQTELINLLNNYDPTWLCLGLEAVLGSRVMQSERCSLRAMFALSATNNNKAKPNKPLKMPQVLKRIVLQYIVHDPLVARKFRLVKRLKTPIDGSLNASDHRTRNVFVNTKKHITGREYFDALTQRFVLKFLLLIKCLDVVIERRRDAFTHFPCLFRVMRVSTTSTTTTTTTDAMDAPIKRSQDVVSAFCRLCLASEGRIDRHLKHLGYELTHVQTPLDEIPLRVTNIAVDLRDGVRLAKLMEALTTTTTHPQKQQKQQKQTLSSYLRVPALSRLQKVHNVEIGLHFLQETCGASVLESIKTTSTTTTTLVPLPLRRSRLSTHVMTTAGTTMSDAKRISALAKDIVDGHREKTLALLWQLISCFQLQSLVDVELLKREIATIEHRMSYRAREFLDGQLTRRRDAHRRRSNSTGAMDDAVNDDALPTSPRDEVYALLLAWCRAVCANYTIAIHDFTNSFADGRALCYLLHYYHPMLLNKRDIRATTATTNEIDTESMETPVQLLQNEAQHFVLVNDRIKQLGDVPVLLPQQFNSHNPPDEKLIVTFVCYLQSRLMDSSREIHAASRLKRWWRSPFIRTRMRIKRNRSARIVQRFWFTSSTKRLAIRQCRRLLRAAHVIKSLLRMWHARVQFTRMRDAATIVQRAWRLWRVQQATSRQQCDAAAVVVQRTWRQFAIRKAEQQRREVERMRRRIAQRLQRKTSAVRIERWWFVVLQRRAAVSARRRLVHARSASATIVQRAWRQQQARSNARMERHATWMQLHASARIVQRQWRLYCYNSALLYRVRVTVSAVKIATAMRKHVVRIQHERARYEQQLRAHERAMKRQQLQRRVELRAALTIQRTYRLFVQRTVATAAARTIQRHVRGALQRRRFTALCALRHDAAVCIQTAFRGAVAVARYRRMHASVVLLQRNVRIWRRQQQLNALISFYELLLTYQDMQEDARERAWIQHAAATCIQTAVRRQQHRSRFVLTIQQLTLLQRNVRAWRWNRHIAVLVRFAAALATYKRMQAARRAALAKRTRHRAAVTIQRAFRAAMARRCAVETAAAVYIQASVRGWYVRRTRCDWFAIQSQLARLRVLVACWTLESCVARWLAYRRDERLRLERQQQRQQAAKCIATCWKTFVLRCVVANKIQRRRDALEQAERTRLAIEQAERTRRQQGIEEAEAAAKAEAEAETRRIEELRVQRESEEAEAAAAKEAARIRQAEEAERVRQEREAERLRQAEEAERIRQAEAERVRQEQEAERIRQELALERLRREEEAERVRREAEAAAVTAAKQEAERIRQVQEAKRVRQEREAQEAAEMEAERIRVQEMEAAKEAERLRQEVIEAEAAAEATRQAAKRLRIEQEAKAAEAQAAEAQAAAAAEAQRREQEELEQMEAERRAIETRRRLKREAAADALYQDELRRQREQQAKAAAQQAAAAATAQHVQKWWRGARVRHELRQSAQRSTAIAKRSTALALVAATNRSDMQRRPEQPATAAAAASSARSTQTTAAVVTTEDEAPPLTLGARLEMALHLLLHGTRVHELLFAAHTIDVCTKYSRECCRRCILLHIPVTIFAAIRGLNRSRPHVELLTQLLSVLENLATYDAWDRSTRVVRTPRTLEKDAAGAALLTTAQAIEALVDLLHMHRDMPHVFARAAAVLLLYVQAFCWRKDDNDNNSSSSSATTTAAQRACAIWRDAHKRVQSLAVLLEKKAAAFAAAMRHVRGTTSGTIERRAGNPHVALALLNKVLTAAANGSETSAAIAAIE